LCLCGEADFRRAGFLPHASGQAARLPYVAAAGAHGHNGGMETPGAVDVDRRRIDAELVRRCVEGDNRAFHELTERYYRPVCGFLFKRVGQADLVEDLAQETFLEAYRALKERRPPEQFSSWLFGIAVNRCGKWLRRKKPALFSPDDPPAQMTT